VTKARHYYQLDSYNIITKQSIVYKQLTAPNGSSQHNKQYLDIVKDNQKKPIRRRSTNSLEMKHVILQDSKRSFHITPQSRDKTILGHHHNHVTIPRDRFLLLFIPT
jgi:hypothetical protein